ncbi:MAG: XRE family transcriptional regulator [Cyclobacteriaceae bacterium]
MFSKEELLKRPNYLLTKYQNEIYRQLVEYMQTNNLTQKDVAERLGASSAYVSQILNGNFNFTLKKLIEIGVMIGKIPVMEFIDPSEFQRREKGATIRPAPSATKRIFKSAPSRKHSIPVTR